MPLLVAPVAFQRLVDPDGEVAMARAAAAAGTIMCLSTLATSHPSEVAAEAPPAPRWFQLYCFSDRGVTRSMIDEAVDMRLRRDRAHRRRSARRAARARLSHRLRGAGRRQRPSRCGGGRLRASRSAHRRCSSSSTRRSPGTALEALAAECSLPIVLKGIQTGADAALAVEHGAAGVVVSNHGGRQLDGVPATLDILPEVVDAVSRGAARC